MKYTIKINEKGIEPVALSEKDLFYENATPTSKIRLYSMYTNEHGDSWTDWINPGDIAGEVERCIENHGNGVDIILMYEYDTKYSGTIGLYPDSVGYTPILSMRWSRDGEIKTPDIKGHGFYYMDEDELQKLYNLIDKAEDIAREVQKHLNSEDNL